MLPLILFLATAVFPSTNSTSWMRPESFHLTVGMNLAEALRTLASAGFKAEKGDDDHHLIVDYTPTQSITLEFRKERLRSIRFELYQPKDKIGAAFEAVGHYLQSSPGATRLKSGTMIIYDGTLPNVMVVLKKQPEQTLSTMVVRYYDPASVK
jgi:hypothetical protein